MKTKYIIIFTILFLIGIKSISASAELISCWSYDSDATDDYSNNDGTLGSGSYEPTHQGSCYIGGCYEYDGSDFINYSSTDFHLNQVTMGGWLYIDVSGTTRAAISLPYNEPGGLSAPTTISYEIRIASNMELIDSYNDGSYHSARSGATTFSTGNWFFATFRYDGTNGVANYNLTEYSDGHTTNSLTNDGTPGLKTGHRYYHQPNGAWWDGKIDEVFIFNGSLSDEDISWLYNSGSGKSCADIISYFAPAEQEFIPPEINIINVTSEGDKRIVYNSTVNFKLTEPFINISETTPTIFIETNENSYCAITNNNQNLNYTNIINGNSDANCTTDSGGGTTHTCTLPTANATHITTFGLYNFSIGCTDISGNENLSSTSGIFTLHYLDSIPPAFSNRQPENNYILNNSGVMIFNITATDISGPSETQDIELWTNHSGTWKKNITDSWTSGENTPFVLSDFPFDQDYIVWAIFAEDYYGNNNWSVNYTLLLNQIVSTDSCNPNSPLSADYEFDCNDNCVLSTNLDAGGYNIAAIGSGEFSIDTGGTISNFNNFALYSDCIFSCRNNDGCFG